MSSASVVPNGLPANLNVIATFESVGCRYLVSQDLGQDDITYSVWFVNAGGSFLTREGSKDYTAVINYVRDKVSAHLAEG